MAESPRPPGSLCQAARLGFPHLNRLLLRFPNLTDVDLVHLDSDISPCEFVPEKNLLPPASIDGRLRVVAQGCPNLRKLVLNAATESGMSSVAEETRPRWEQTLLSDFPSLSHSMFDPNCVGEIIKRQNNAFLSFRFFQWVSSQPGFSPVPQFCSVLFNTLVEAKAAKAAKSFLPSFPEFQPQPPSLESFIRCLCDNGAIYDAHDVFSWLKSFQLCAFSISLEFSSFGFSTYMMESGLVGDVDTVGYLIRAFCKDNKLSKAYELLRQVIEATHTPDNIAFTKLISGFCRDGYYVKVSELLHLMIAKDRLPDIFTSQEIIYGLYKNGMRNEAFPDIFTYQEIIYIFDPIHYYYIITSNVKC
ncbi:pentatricopeptide repeat-containing protein At5g18950-like [Telopea speciosissima]|uniref:pentatricopeptide repeat-containing protein At5g18950-like n=1 Tax=Telopea speciosissima TaxID=54955 RepID=UPI001CC3722D|nr:pentatricopeptide repeat-containing protein At5g18950-like [Telopea speciosissima]